MVDAEHASAEPVEHGLVAAAHGLARLGALDRDRRSGGAGHLRGDGLAVDTGLEVTVIPGAATASAFCSVAYGAVSVPRLVSEPVGETHLWVVCAYAGADSPETTASAAATSATTTATRDGTRADRACGIFSSEIATGSG